MYVYRKKRDFSTWPNRSKKNPSDTAVQPASNVTPPVEIDSLIVEKSPIVISQTQKERDFLTWPGRYGKIPSDTAVQSASNVISPVGIDLVVVENT